MSQPVISVEHLSKSYILQHKNHGSYVALRDIISDRFKSALGKKDKNFKASEEFLALDDISFEINSGDTVGIIGRNGAGKSTLLKILSRIVNPTKGKVTLEGRIASLLEVGTGFHPELSGRENIFLNGSILGMSRSEIKNKFDEIVAFAEIERFLDTPVKRYSSGMYVRLAFAVAAHLDPEILIVDEVLAVGDAQFQQKCLGKMEDISNNQGRTVLFVSHNLSAVQKLCKKGILLHKGRIVCDDRIDVVTEKYLASTFDKSAQVEFNADENNYGRPLSLVVEGLDGKVLPEIPVGRPFRVRVEFELFKDLDHFIVALGLSSASHVSIRTAYSTPAFMKKGKYVAQFIFDDIILATGLYTLHLGLSSFENSFYYKEEIVSLQISEISELMGNKQVIRTSGVGFIINPMKVLIEKTDNNG